MSAAISGRKSVDQADRFGQDWTQRTALRARVEW
jgi:hypothetical protein